MKLQVSIYDLIEMEKLITEKIEESKDILEINFVAELSDITLNILKEATDKDTDDVSDLLGNLEISNYEDTENFIKDLNNNQPIIYVPVDLIASYGITIWKKNEQLNKLTRNDNEFFSNLIDHLIERILNFSVKDEFYNTYDLLLDIVTSKDYKKLFEKEKQLFKGY